MQGLSDLSDLREFIAKPTLSLPIGGKTFTVEPVTAEIWLQLQAVMADSEAAASGDAEALARANKIRDVDVFRLALGATFDELLPHVTGDELMKAGTTAWFWQLGQSELAATFWQSGGKARATVPTPAPSTRTSTGKATTTRRRASTSGMTSRPKSPANSKARKNP